MPHGCGESAKGLLWLVGGNGVCMVLCVCVSLIFPKNLAGMLIVFLLLDRKSILAED